MIHFPHVRPQQILENKASESQERRPKERPLRQTGAPHHRGSQESQEQRKRFSQKKVKLFLRAKKTKQMKQMKILFQEKKRIRKRKKKKKQMIKKLKNKLKRNNNQRWQLSKKQK